MLAVLRRALRKGADRLLGPSDMEMALPPFLDGLRVLDPALLLEKHADLIRDIQHYMEMKPAVFDETVLPIIKRWADFAHFLPASKDHHHRDAGGLFRHGLEVARVALIEARGIPVALDEPPALRIKYALRWRVAIGVCGLLHDAGKPITDFVITDRSGTLRWNPRQMTIREWARREKLDRYFIAWNDERNKQHEMATWEAVQDCIIDRTFRDWMELPNVRRGPAGEMQSVLMGTVGQRKSPILLYVQEGDQRSVAADVKIHGAMGQPSQGLVVPMAQYISQAIHQLVDTGSWRANEPGSRVWVVVDGFMKPRAFVVFPHAANDIRQFLLSSGVPGIPGSPDDMADRMIDFGLALPRTYQDGRSFRYHSVAPDPLRKADGTPTVLGMVELVALEAVFGYLPPPPTVGALIDDDADAACSKKASVLPPVVQSPVLAATSVASAPPPPPASLNAPWSAESSAAPVPPLQPFVPPTSAPAVPSAPVAEKDDLWFGDEDILGGGTSPRPTDRPTAAAGGAARQEPQQAGGTGAPRAQADDPFGTVEGDDLDEVFNWGPPPSSPGQPAPVQALAVQPQASTDDVASFGDPRENQPLPVSSRSDAEPRWADCQKPHVAALADRGIAGRLLLRMVMDIVAGSTVREDLFRPADKGGALCVVHPAGTTRYRDFELPTGQARTPPETMVLLADEGLVTRRMTVPAGGVVGLPLAKRIAEAIQALTETRTADTPVMENPVVASPPEMVEHAAPILMEAGERSTGNTMGGADTGAVVSALPHATVDPKPELPEPISSKDDEPDPDTNGRAAIATIVNGFFDPITAPDTITARAVADYCRATNKMPEAILRAVMETGAYSRHGTDFRKRAGIGG